MPRRSQTPSYDRSHVDSPRDGCPLPCCRITVDHRRDAFGFGDVTAPVAVTHVWSWERGKWEVETPLRGDQG